MYVRIIDEGLGLGERHNLVGRAGRVVLSEEMLVHLIHSLEVLNVLLWEERKFSLTQMQRIFYKRHL